MMSLTNRERATAIASALVAIAILGIGATAQPRPGNRLARLESDLRYQMELGSRLDRPTFEARSQALEAALAAWRGSSQSAEDDERLAAWLQESLVRSLPGETGAWPATPGFEAEERLEARGQKAEGGRRKGEGGGRNAEGGLRKAEGNAATVNGGVTPAEGAEVSAPDGEAAREVHAVPESEALAKPERDLPRHNQGEPRSAPTVVQAAEAYHVEKPAPVVAESAEPADRVAVETAPASRAPAISVSASRPAPARPAPVQVNLAELNARIHGYHEGLREIEAALVASGGEATIAEVTRWTGHLEELAAQQRFVRLYYDSLTAAERRGVAPPRRMADTVRRVEHQRQRIEVAGDEDFFAASEPADGPSALAARLKSLAADPPER